MSIHSNEGYTLLETMLSVALSIVMLTAALRILSYASVSTGRAAVRCDLTESARISADILSSYIQRSTELKIDLHKVTIKAPDKCTFSYYPNVSDSSASYHRLIYDAGASSNEVASNLADIRFILDGADTVFIEITTDNTVTISYNDAAGVSGLKMGGVTVEPVFIRVPVSLSGKKLQK